MAAVFRWYLKSVKNHPWKTQSLTAGVLLTCGDVISQAFVENKKITEIEKKRTARFAVLGTFYVGPALKMWYHQLEKLFGVAGRTVGLKKMLLDQSAFAPCLLLGFMSANGFLRNDSFKKIEEDLKKDYLSVLKVNYMVWPATQLVTFYLVPLNLRVLFVSSVALFWNTYLAWKTNSV